MTAPRHLADWFSAAILLLVVVVVCVAVHAVFGFAMMQIAPHHWYVVEYRTQVFRAGYPMTTMVVVQTPYESESQCLERATGPRESGSTIASYACHLMKDDDAARDRLPRDIRSDLRN